MSLPNPTLNGPRLYPPQQPTHKRHGSRSPRRLVRSQSPDFKDFYRDLSPSKTLRVIVASTQSDTQTAHDEERLLQSIESASNEEKAFAQRVAESSKLLKELCQELEQWPWYGTFELNDADDPERSTSNIADTSEVRQAYFQHSDTISPQIPAEDIPDLEQRLEEISDELVDLNMEELKAHVRQMHNFSKDTLTQDANLQLETQLSQHSDGLKALVTVTILQGLRYRTQLLDLIVTWTARLAVFREVPKLSLELTDLNTRLFGAYKIINSPLKISWKTSEALTIPSDINLFRDLVESERKDLEARVKAIGSRVDQMLDLLEGRPETLPDSWIDMVEQFEIGFSAWTQEARAKVQDVEKWAEISRGERASMRDMTQVESPVECIVSVSSGDDSNQELHPVESVDVQDSLHSSEGKLEVTQSDLISEKSMMLNGNSLIVKNLQEPGVETLVSSNEPKLSALGTDEFALSTGHDEAKETVSFIENMRESRAAENLFSEENKRGESLAMSDTVLSTVISGHDTVLATSQNSNIHLIQDMEFDNDSEAALAPADAKYDVSSFPKQGSLLSNDDGVFSAKDTPELDWHSDVEVISETVLQSEKESNNFIANTTLLEPGSESEITHNSSESSELPMFFEQPMMENQSLAFDDVDPAIAAEHGHNDNANNKQSSPTSDTLSDSAFESAEKNFFVNQQNIVQPTASIHEKVATNSTNGTFVKDQINIDNSVPQKNLLVDQPGNVSIKFSESKSHTGLGREADIEFSPKEQKASLAMSGESIRPDVESAKRVDSFSAAKSDNSTSDVTGNPYEVVAEFPLSPMTGANATLSELNAPLEGPGPEVTTAAISQSENQKEFDTAEATDSTQSNTRMEPLTLVVAQPTNISEKILVDKNTLPTRSGLAEDLDTKSRTSEGKPISTCNTPAIGITDHSEVSSGCVVSSDNKDSTDNTAPSPNLTRPTVDSCTNSYCDTYDDRFIQDELRAIEDIICADDKTLEQCKPLVANDYQGQTAISTDGPVAVVNRPYVPTHSRDISKDSNWTISTDRSSPEIYDASTAHVIRPNEIFTPTLVDQFQSSYLALSENNSRIVSDPLPQLPSSQNSNHTSTQSIQFSKHITSDTGDLAKEVPGRSINSDSSNLDKSTPCTAERSSQVPIAAPDRSDVNHRNLQRRSSDPDWSRHFYSGSLSDEKPYTDRSKHFTIPIDIKVMPKLDLTSIRSQAANEQMISEPEEVLPSTNTSKSESATNHKSIEKALGTPGIPGDSFPEARERFTESLEIPDAITMIDFDADKVLPSIESPLETLPEINTPEAELDEEDLVRSPRSRSSTGSSDMQLDRQIDQILASVPTRIHFEKSYIPKYQGRHLQTPPPSANVPRSSTKSPSPVKSSPGIEQSTFFTLSAANKREARVPRSNFDSAIRLYHLAVPGRALPIKLYIRRVGENGERVMVRVGGGWADLGEYLREYAAHHSRLVTPDRTQQIPAETQKHKSAIRSRTPALSSRSASPETLISTTKRAGPQGSSNSKAWPRSASALSGSYKSVTFANQTFPASSRLEPPLGSGKGKASKVERRISSPAPSTETSSTREKTRTRDHPDSNSPSLLGPSIGRKTELTPEKKQWLDDMVARAKQWKLNKNTGFFDGFEDIGTAGNTRRVFGVRSVSSGGPPSTSPSAN